MSNTKHIGAILLMLLLGAELTSLYAKDGLRISVDVPAKVWENERFSLTYTIEADEEIESVSELFQNDKNLEIVSRPQINRYILQSRHNKTGLLYKTEVAFVLQADTEGRYTLPAIEVVYKGKKKKSEKQFIKVTSLGDTKQSDVAFIRVVQSKQGMKLADTLTVTYKLYTTMEIGNVVSMDNVSVGGLYLFDVSPNHLIYTEENIDGKTYMVIELRKLLVEPMREGVFELPAGEVEIEFLQPTGKRHRSFWGREYDEKIERNGILKFDSVGIRVFELKDSFQTI